MTNSHKPGSPNNGPAAKDITADAVALQERDEFRSQGWVKVVSPAKVNLHLAIGAKRSDGYHAVHTVMHALNLHDVVYMRRMPADEEASTTNAPTSASTVQSIPTIKMVSMGDVQAPDIPADSNIAAKAVMRLAEKLGEDASSIELRIEKNIPAQGGLGGGSSNAAAALLGAAELWGLSKNDPAIEDAARTLGSDVAFFLHGGCSYYEGTGDVFVHELKPSKAAVALVKPEGGVSTAAAYRTFDESPVPVPDKIAAQVLGAKRAEDIGLFNNLAAASEHLMPELAEVRVWLEETACVSDVLLCGSGATTFAICDDFSAACNVVASARKRGWWARATSFGSIRAMTIPN